MEERLREDGACAMSLSSVLLHQLADRLYEAQSSRQPIDSLAKSNPGLTEENAYEIQMSNVGRGLKEGGRIVGYKIGLTSREAQKQFQVFKPDYGHLFNSMAVLEEEEIAVQRLIQPKIEGEIAFILGRDLKGPGITLVDVLRSVEYATVALEIVDSRIRDWKITAVDTIADNGSSALFVLGGKKTLADRFDFRSVGMALSRNGEVLVTGSGAAVMGNPLSALVFLANEMGRRDRALLAGDVVLSGSLSSMLPVSAGNAFSCEIAGLGGVAVRFGVEEGRR
jgi:2-keto-4-pentenoate hydratase